MSFVRSFYAPDFVLSRYKGSVRLYELVAIARKTTALFLSVFLASGSVQRQAHGMLGMVVISFLLHCRLLPYDDQNQMNTFNSVDAALSNNTLETWLLVLQMCQLAFGLVTEAVDVPYWLQSVVYLLVVLLAVVLSLIALSSKLSRALHEQYQLIEPWVHAFMLRLGLASSGNHGDDDDDGGMQKRKQRENLMQLAKSIESKQKVLAAERRRKSEALVVLSHETVGAKARVEATQRHKKALAKKKNALQIEHEKFLKRQQAGKLHTHADDIGRLSASTESLQAYSAKRQEMERKRATDGKFLETERKDWEKRKSKVS